MPKLIFMLSLLLAAVCSVADDFSGLKISSVYVRAHGGDSIYIYTNPVIPNTCANNDGSVLITNSQSPSEYEKMMYSLALALHAADKEIQLEVNCTSKKVLRIATKR